MVCTTTMAVVTAATDGGLLRPLRECAMGAANNQNGTIHRRIRNTPARRRSGDSQPISRPRWTIHRACRFPAPCALALNGGGASLLRRAYDHLWLITARNGMAKLASLGCAFHPVHFPAVLA
jgi:hypothetical protein